MTRKHVTKKQQFWPGSNIIKSSNNAFDWQNTAKGLYSRAELSSLEQGVRAKISTEFKPSITTFAKAKASRFTNL
jgi:hypothetical protein